MSLRRLSGNVVASIVNVLASAVLLFLLYRFLVQEIGAAEIGLWSLVMAAASAARLGDFGLGNGVVKFVASDLGAGHKVAAAGTVGIGLVLIGLLMTALCCLLWFLLPGLLAAVLPDQEAMLAAMDLLPWALASLWLTTLANVFVGALDGAQRTDLRAWAVTLAGVAQLLSAYWLVPTGGLSAMGPVQGIYALVMLVLTASATLYVFRQPLSSWIHWPGDRVRELIRYGGTFQLAAIGQLAFEPAVKFFLGAFGSLTLTGYFEMANRAVSQFRQVIGAAYQMLVPYVAARIGADHYDQDRLADTYQYAWRLLMLTAIPYFTLIACGLPWLLTVWIGRFEPAFILIGLLCLMGWMVNAAALPSYVLYLAIGRLRWTVLTQVVIGVLSLAFSSLGGWLAGGIGVVIGAMMALALGSLVVPFAFHSEYRVGTWSLLNGGALVLLVAGLIASLISFELSNQWAGKGWWPSWVWLPALTYLALALAVVWQDPLRKDVMDRMAR